MKIFTFLKKAIITLFGLFIVFIAGCFLCVYSYSRFDKEAQSSYLLKYSPAAENIYTDITPNDELNAKLNSFIISLPPNVSEAFLKDWKITISPYTPELFNLSSKTPQNTLGENDISNDLYSLGYSDWHLRLIYISAQPDPDITYKVFIHELGHCFDYEFGTPSSTDKFQQIYNQYKDSFVGADELDMVSYASSSSEEFFATVFKEYFLFPEHLKAHVPEAYSFLEELFTEISNDASASTTVKYDLQSVLLILKKNIQK